LNQRKKHNEPSDRLCGDLCSVSINPEISPTKNAIMDALKLIHILYMDIKQYSDPAEVNRKATKYLGKKVRVMRSSKKDKKYMVVTPEGRTVHFGQMGYEDYTKHKNKTRRKNYLTRSGKIKGDWAKDKYSANNLARHLLW
jgi:hypothetical protein